MKTHIILEESDIAGRTEDGKPQLTLAAKDAMRGAELVTFGNQILKNRHGSLDSCELPNECKTTNFVTTDTIPPASETRMEPDETPCSQLFVEHSNFMWQIWKGDELGHAVIITRSCGKSIGTKHPLRSGQIPTEIEDRLLAANASQFGILNVTEFVESKTEMSLRDWFARETPTDEIQSMTYNHLSLMAQERLAGIKKPTADHNLAGEAVRLFNLPNVKENPTP